MEADDGALPQSTLEADGTGDLRRSEPADFDVEADAHPDVTPFLPQLRLLFPQTGVVDVRKRFVEHGRIISAVVLETGHDVVAVLEVRDQVLLAQLRRIHLQLVGETID